MPARRNLIGHPPFGRLTVLRRGPDYTRNGHSRSQWYCQCACGTEILVLAQSLLCGATVSCGCFHKEQVSQLFTTHGLTHTPEYQSWNHMKGRCLNPQDKAYKNYGGRGISACQRWIDSFESFLEDMGPQPSPQHTLDRYPDMNGNYEPSNTRWASTREQMYNIRTNHMITIDGHTACLGEWLHIKGINRQTFHGRVALGWSEKEALTLPLQPHNTYKQPITIDGHTAHLSEWLQIKKLAFSTFYRRINRGMSVEEALTKTDMRFNKNK